MDTTLLNKKNLFMTFGILFFLLLLVKLTTPLPITTYHATDLHYKGEKSASKSSDFIKITSLQHVVKPKFMLMDFNFKPFNLDNNPLFQIGHPPRALRMEITPPGILKLILGDGQTLVLAKNMEINRSYHIRLLTDFNDYLKVDLEQDKYRMSHPQLKTLAYNFSELVIGAGFSKLQPFEGELQHVKFSLIYTQKTFFHSVLNGLINVSVFCLAILVLLQLKSSWPDKSTYPLSSLVTLFAVTGWGLGFSVLSCIMTHYTHLSQSIPYGIFLMSYASLIFFPQKQRKRLVTFIEKNRWFFGVVTLLTLVFFLINMAWIPLYSYPLSIDSLLLSSIVISVCLMVKLTKAPDDFFKQLPLVLMIASTLFLAWISIFESPKGLDIMEQIKTHSSTLSLGSLALLLTIIFIFQDKPDTLLQRKVAKRAYYLIDVAAILAFLWISLRCNNAEWQNSVALFAAACIGYGMAAKYAKYSLFNRIIALLLIISGLFYAEPGLYPCNSMMRFFWCYGLIAYFLWKPVYSAKHALGTTLLWLVAVVGSPENLLYATCIFFSASVAQFYLCSTSRSISLASLILRHFMIPLGLLLITLSVASFFDTTNPYHLLDVARIPWNGSIVYVGLLFIGLIHLYMGLDKSFKKSAYQVPIAAMLGGLSAMVIYNLGTAELWNILPVFGFMMYFAVLMTKHKSLGLYKITLQLTAIPLLFILLMNPLLHQSYYV
ncbi:MAG: hypothetical protein CK424_01565 [Legionella sp.]|nr:MAG: hypothetical protein CK424_01565 [Legionella sp.]